MENRSLPQPWEISPEFLRGAKELAEKTGDEDALRLLKFWVAQRDEHVAEEKLMYLVRDWEESASPLSQLRRALFRRVDGSARLREQADGLRDLARKAPDLLQTIINTIEELADAVEGQERFSRAWQEAKEESDGEGE